MVARLAGRALIVRAIRIIIIICIMHIIIAVRILLRKRHHICGKLDTSLLVKTFTPGTSCHGCLIDVVLQFLVFVYILATSISIYVLLALREA